MINNDGMAGQMSPTVASASDKELAFIASLNYGQHQKRHHDALRHLITSQNGQLQEGQYWFPYEVIELGAHALKPGHEREFAICTLLVIAAVRSGFDKATDVRQKFQDRAEDYDRLPETLRQEILEAYLSVDGP